jgi:hypothetical protein
VRERFVEAAEFAVKIAQIVVRLCVVGVARNGFPVVRQSSGGISLAREGDRQIIVGGGVVLLGHKILGLLDIAAEGVSI